MMNFNTNENQEKKSNKKKWILIGAGGAVVLVGVGFFIGKKIGVKLGQDSVMKISSQFGNVARDTIVSNPIPLPEQTTSLWKKIDEDVFVNVASEIENALCDNCIEDLHLERSWDVAEGVVKNLTVTMNTVHTPV